MYFDPIGTLEPQALDKEGVRKFLSIGPKVLQRMVWASRNGDRWLDFATNHNGRPRMRVTFTLESARYAFARLCRGEEPPLLPCEPIRKRAVTSGARC